MINTFKVRKYASVVCGGMIPVMFFWLGVQLISFWVGLGMLFLGLLVSVIISIVLLDNPFRQLLEGKGVLLLDISSTGIITPFVCGMDQPFIKGRFKGKEVKDIFDREAVMNLAPPQPTKKNQFQGVKMEDGMLRVNIDSDTYSKARFAMYHYPVLIFNSQIGSIITKDFLAGQEKEIFAEHTVLYLNRKMEELTSVVRDFGRHVVEQLKPTSGSVASKIMIVVLIVGLLLLGALFLPKIINLIMGSGGSAATDAISKAAGSAVKDTGAIIPK